MKNIDEHIKGFLLQQTGLLPSQDEMSDMPADLREPLPDNADKNERMRRGMRLISWWDSRRLDNHRGGRNAIMF